MRIENQYSRKREKTLENQYSKDLLARNLQIQKKKLDERLKEIEIQEREAWRKARERLVN